MIYFLIGIGALLVGILIGIVILAIGISTISFMPFK